MATASVRSPALLLIAVSRIYPTLADRLAPAEWREIRPELDSAIAILADSTRSSDHPAATVAVIRLLSRSAAGREMLGGRLAAQDAVLGLGAVPQVLAALDLDAPPATSSSSERGVTLGPGGVGGGKSFKLKNFRLDFLELIKIGSSAAVSLQAILGNPSPVVIAASVLTVVQSLMASTTTAIGEDEASLFWSFIQTAGDRDDKTATEAELRAASDQHRREFGLEPFTPTGFVKALKTLEALSSIVPAGEARWRLTESYRVSG
ncbi:hypothetical protein ACFLIM_33815 [Nonomuraea sp. M3C6]|uniref:Uncharacterized protein n=1 Tax=Nonomuraea marmarensis TaxID=3351344 RepID=A0ABW7ALD2_9ACTN